MGRGLRRPGVRPWPSAPLDWDLCLWPRRRRCTAQEWDVRMQSGISRRRAAALAEGGAAYAERRAEIIATAAKIFREKGFRGASLADVAESLGTDRASLYYYIGSKEELFHEIVRDAAEANARQAEAIRDGTGTAVDKLG